MGEHTRDAWSGFFAFLRGIRLERCGGELSVRGFQENFNAAFRLFDLFLAFLGELDALFEQFHCFVEGKVGMFEAANDLLEARQGLLEINLGGSLGDAGGIGTGQFFLRR